MFMMVVGFLFQISLYLFCFKLEFFCILYDFSMVCNVSLVFILMRMLWVFFSLIVQLYMKLHYDYFVQFVIGFYVDIFCIVLLIIMLFIYLFICCSTSYQGYSFAVQFVIDAFSFILVQIWRLVAKRQILWDYLNSNNFL